jgi:cell wall assembly regulator SMI1
MVIVFGSPLYKNATQCYAAATPYMNVVKIKTCLAAESINGWKYTGTQDSHLPTVYLIATGWLTLLFKMKQGNHIILDLEGKYNYTHAKLHLVGNLLY